MSRDDLKWRVSVNGAEHQVVIPMGRGPWVKAFPIGVETGTGIHWGENSGRPYAHIDEYSRGLTCGKVDLSQTQLILTTVGPQPITVAATSNFASAAVMPLQSGATQLGFSHVFGTVTVSANAQVQIGVLFFTPPPAPFVT